MPNDPAPSGVAGLDDIIGGGFPRCRTYLIQGVPGAGKTTLALQFLLEGIRRGERCLYVTLSETQEELQGVADTHGWSLAGIAIMELSAIEDLIDHQQQTTMLHPAEVDLTRTVDRILAAIESTQPDRIVFDSLAELRLLSQDALRFRRQILWLKQVLLRRHATVLFLDDRSVQANDQQVQSIVHGVVTLDRMPTGYGVMHRRLIVDKLRGVDFRTGYHDYTIVRGGCVVYPRLIASEHHTVHNAKPIDSGIPELDAMFGGGIERGSSLLLLGPAGSGKSSIATCFLHAAASRGERALVWGFEETRQVFLERGRGLGRDLSGFLEAGLLRYHAVDPASLSPGQLSTRIREEVEEGDVKLVLIDSLTGYLASMPSEEHLHLHLHELLTYLNQQGVVSLLTLAQHGLIATQTGPDVSYIADSVLMLRFFEAYGSVRKAVSVVKKRMSGHEDTIREFSTTGGRIRLGDPLQLFQGVLGGTPVFHGERKDLFPRQA